MDFEVVGKIGDAETIAIGKSIREIDRLQKTYGRGRWRKRKGTATIRLADDTIKKAEVHWYEPHGIGRKEIKIKKRHFSLNTTALCCHLHSWFFV